MNFRFYSNAISQASRNVAAGIFIMGLVLIGFGFLIWVLQKLFAMLFAVVFCVAGLGCAITAVKLFWAIHKMQKQHSDDSQQCRKNVRIHHEDSCDV